MKDEGINVVSLFNGMGCCEIALIELGIKINKYYSSEIDKFALKTTRHNFPNDIELGDVRYIDGTKLPYIDLFTFGSPCQSFSFAGKRKGMATVDCQEIYTLEKYLQLKSEGFEFEGQSYLFWEAMRLMNEIKPTYFLFENVEMGKKWETVLTKAMGIPAIHINSALVSAQNRKRIYVTNIAAVPNGLFGDLVCSIPQPKDQGILLRDILEKDVDEKYYLSDLAINRVIRRNENGFCASVNPDKTGTLDCKNNSPQLGVNKGTTLIIDKLLNQKLNQEKASCFTAGGHSGGNHSDMDLICVAMRGRNPENPTSREAGINTEQMIEPRQDEKTNCLTSVQKDNLVCLTPKRTEYGKEIRKDYEVGNIDAQRKEITQLEPRNDDKTNTLSTVQKDNLIAEKKNYIQWDTSGKGYDSQQDRAFYEDGKHGSLCAGRTENKCNVLLNTSRIRRLTPTECKKLQTVPDWFDMSVVSDSQQYRQLGNGWTVKVIEHILSYLPFQKPS